MRCYVDHPSRADFRKAFLSERELMFVRSREHLSKPDMSLGTVADGHPDLLVVGPGKSWFARIERTANGSLRIYDGKVSYTRKKRAVRRNRR